MNQKEFLRLQKLYQDESKLIETGKFGSGLWPIDQSLGYFLNRLIRLFDLKKGLEVGAGVGYSTIWMASAFKETAGKLASLEFFPPKVLQWEDHMKTVFGSSYLHFVDVIPSSFERASEHFGTKKFDFVFFDQRKSDYLKHLQVLLPKIKKGAFICADNVISHQEPCLEYLNFVRKDPRFSSTLIEQGAGLEVSRYRGN